jgi:curved DNA-binding protein CbpA
MDRSLGGTMAGRRPQSDPYEVLGIPRDASGADASRAYRKLARDLHPDSRPTSADAADRLRAVMAAHELLSDPARRAAYDRQATHRPAAPPRDAARGAALSGAATQPHPLGPAAVCPGTFPSRPGPALQPGPVRIEPPPHPRQETRSDAAMALAELRLLQLIAHYSCLTACRTW